MRGGIWGKTTEMSIVELVRVRFSDSQTMSDIKTSGEQEMAVQGSELSSGGHFDASLAARNQTAE